MSDTAESPGELSLVFDEFLARRRQGESPTLDEYCQRFPNLAEQLRLHVGLYDALGEAGPATDDRGARPEVDPSTAPRTTEILATPDDAKRSLGSAEDDDIQRTLAAENGKPFALPRRHLDAVTDTCRARVMAPFNGYRCARALRAPVRHSAGEVNDARNAMGHLFRIVSSSPTRGD